MNDSKNITKLVNNLENEAAKIQELQGLVSSDDELSENLIVDFLEGETEVFELLDVIWKEISERQIMIDGLTTHIKTCNERTSRLDNGIKKLRAVMCYALKKAGQKKVTRPLYTLSLKETPEKLVIEQESEIPSLYFKQPNPVVDKKALATAALKDGEEIEGAFLTEKGFNISIRNK